MEDITFDEFSSKWSSKPRKHGNQLLRLFHDFLVKKWHCFVHQASRLVLNIGCAPLQIHAGNGPGWAEVGIEYAAEAHLSDPIAEIH